ncbi:MAG: CDP-alcohol phosphatidyltransferase family protein [Hyphomicrobiales bacterium]|nr:CDP-alcohol phosphatidyltransferase family protein [Hyphomicrobiales bacterium]
MAVMLIVVSSFPAALVCILINRLLDGLDGSVARIIGPTDRGAFLDITLDFFFYGTIPLGFAVVDPDANALAAATLLLAFIGTGSSFLAYSTISHKRNETVHAYSGKGIQFIGGLTEGAETIALFVAICVFPTSFPYLAYSFSVVAGFTIVFRWFWGWHQFGKKLRS